MTAKQCETARRLLGWSLEHLSNRVGGHPSANTIRNFERHWKQLEADHLTAICVEFEHTGVEFDVDGATVRLYRH